jgi:hypothetical protein
MVIPHLLGGANRSARSKKNHNGMFRTLPLPQTSSGVPSKKCWVIQTRLAADMQDGDPG